MAGGEVCKETFYLATEPTEKKVRLDVPAFSQNVCCFKLPVLAELVGTDEFKNDQHSVLKRYDKNLYDTVIITLQKYVDGEYVDQVDLFDDTYGTNYFFGFVSDSTDRLAYVGYNIEWRAVLNGFGEGTYRIKFREFDFVAVETESFYQFEFCLKAYLQHRADGTVRFEWYTKGYRGDYEDDLDIWDFTTVAAKVKGDGWFNQIRLPDSFFGFNKSSYEREYIKYSNGQQVWISDEQIESYEFHSGMFPAELHDWIKTNVVQADRILITDYNKNNPNILANKAVKPSGAYEPSWNHNNLRAFVSIDFEQEYQNRKKLRC